MSLEAAIIILSIVIRRHVLFISDTHCVSSLTFDPILLPVQMPLTIMYFVRSGGIDVVNPTDPIL